MSSAKDFKELINLASEALGTKVLKASDDFFAPKENLIKKKAAIFLPDKYTERGKWMDGWESRRKRVPGHDWCILRLGAPGIIYGLNVDTAFFVGNFPEHCSVDAARVTESKSAVTSFQWTEIVRKTALEGGKENFIAVANRETWTHLRLNIFPDGGVARLRVHGKVVADWKRIQSKKGLVDLAAVENQGRVVACNDKFFGHADNLIMPGRAAHMGEGWETRRRRRPGNDWIIVRLGVPGKLRKIEVDTNHYKGNYPDTCSLEGCFAEVADDPLAEFSPEGREWIEIVPRTKLKPHHRHYFEKELSKAVKNTVFTHVRLQIFPDGGISRLRVHGEIA